MVLKAQDVVARGGTVLTRHAVTSARRSADQGHWDYTLRASDGALVYGKARAIVNAAGPWADVVDAQVVAKNDPGKLRHVRGSHIVVPAIPGLTHAFLLQHSDGRVVFVIPYEGDFTLIGTTDQNHEGDPKDVYCTPEEVTYLWGGFPVPKAIDQP